MIRGKYTLAANENEQVLAIVKGALTTLAAVKSKAVSLTEFDIAPCHIREAMRELGWHDDDFETNGWEGDTWYYFSHEDYEYQAVMYYCGYTFSVEMYRIDIDD